MQQANGSSVVSSVLVVISYDPRGSSQLSIDREQCTFQEDVARAPPDELASELLASLAQFRIENLVQSVSYENE